MRNLDTGLPRRRHRRQLRTYDNCFTGVEATEWLHKHLKKNPNFDTKEVTREQTVRLLGKLLLAGVITPVTAQSVWKFINRMKEAFPGTAGLYSVRYSKLWLSTVHGF